jgi:DNA gyrase subunit B
LAKPPLFGLIKGTGSQRKIEYIYNEDALEQTLNKRIEERKAAGTKINPEDERFKQAGYTAQQRFKGLGEMDASQLWATTMNPKTRTLIRVNIEDAEKADAIFTKLMGSEAELRKNFIQSRAATVDLDDLDF